MLIYLLCGYAGSGKDTVGAIYERVGFRRYAFADVLKAYVADLHGFNYALTQTEKGKDTLVTSKKTKRLATVRTFLIEDSDRVKKEKADDGYWAAIVSERIKAETPKYVVITDWRYQAELAKLKADLPEAKIIRVRVIRESVKVSPDPSEHDLDNITCDFTLYNNTNMDTLTSQAYEVLAKEI